MAIHAKCKTGPYMVRHCEAVAMAAEIMADEAERRGHAVDTKTVVAGALLHDIGRTRSQTVRHGVEGAEILEGEGVDRKVVEIVRRHVGAGISPEEAKKLGLPDFDYIPRTLEERIVCFADKMVDADKVRPFGEEVHRFTAKSHDVGRLLALKRGLAEDLGVDPEKLIFDKIKESGSKAAK
ncbi:MAG TPA: HDIG domain-containing protein [Nitrososphaerales archaeon]|nr:HDIG domain-containing protein [Nitrososphaerales archaeon]